MLSQSWELASKSREAGEMESLVSLQSYEPKLQAYLLEQRYPAIMEALLTGLAVMVPEDPWKFMMEKIAELIEAGDGAEIYWDMFVDETLRPPVRILDAMDDADLPTQEILEKVFVHRKMSLQHLCFNGWKQFCKQEKMENEKFEKRLTKAKRYYVHKTEGTIFQSWKISFLA